LYQTYKKLFYLACSHLFLNVASQIKQLHTLAVAAAAIS
jgi:hypothetical protein